jgi:hypothetical protein
VRARRRAMQLRYAMIEAMSRAELIAFIRAGIEQGELMEEFAITRALPQSSKKVGNSKSFPPPVGGDVLR